MNTRWEYKNIRDPIHGFVGVTKRELLLLDTFPMQRLRRIKQLACADLIYPGAVHTRFEHSIGTLYVADKMAVRIGLNSHEREIIRLASLLHDVGHGPFSHIFEAILSIANQKGVGHEEITVNIIKKVPEVSDILGDLHDNVLELFEDPEIESASREILSSKIDADKLDYLQRDSYHAGVTYGFFDFERILLKLSKIENDSESHLVVEKKGADALENFRLAKLSMHKQVYQHHVRAITDAMIMRMGELALEKGIIPISQLKIPMCESRIEEFLQMDDVSFLKDMLGKDDNVSEFVERLLKRDLFKIGFEKPMEDMDALVRMELIKNWGPEKDKKLKYTNMENEIAENVGIDPEFIIIYIREIKNILSPDFRSKLLSTHPPLYIKMEDGKLLDFDQYTSIKGKSQSEFTFFVFCPDEIKDKVKDCAQDLVQ